MRKYLLSALMMIFLSPLAFADTPDLKSAEQVAKKYMQLSTSGDSQGAAQLIDPESVNQMKPNIIAAIQYVQSSDPDVIKQAGIPTSTEQLEKLSPQNLYIALMKMTDSIARSEAQKDPQTKAHFDSLKSTSSSVKVLDSKKLPDGNAQVEIQSFNPWVNHTENTSYVLRLYHSQWKVVVITK